MLGDLNGAIADFLKASNLGDTLSVSALREMVK